MSLSPPKPSRLLSNWDQVARRIRESRRVLLFLDFDGTLVPFASRPEQARLSGRARRILRRLARHPRVTLVVISGRRRADLLRHVGIRTIRYFGLYGWERTGRHRLPGPAQNALHRARQQLARRLSPYPGVWVEDKRTSLCVHLRGVPARVRRRVRRQLRALSRPFQRSLRLFENLRDADIVPRLNSGKGAAVRRLLAQPRFRRALPIYFGDDHSDEPAFAALRRGISVRVGPPLPTRARYRVRDPDEVASALLRLEAALP